MGRPGTDGDDAPGQPTTSDWRPCCPLPSLSAPSKASRRFPYLPRDKVVRFPNQVWSTDLTYVQMGDATCTRRR